LGVVAVPVCGFCPVVVLGCCASASDTVSTVGEIATLSAASPKIEKALRREITPVSVFSVTFNLPM
jgi:hypothetical protein